MKKFRILHNKIAFMLTLLLCVGIFALLTTGCENNESENGQRPWPWQQSTEEAETLTDEQSFDLLMDELFADWVTSDTLSMNYFLADPDKLDIQRPEPTFGEVVTQKLIEESKQETKEMAERLDRFDYSELREDQQIVYDIIKRRIEISEILERDDEFSYYTGYIRPRNGIQVQLPVLLAEFSFYTAEDIERYLDLIEDTHRYFSDIIEFERERSRRGYFLSDANVDSVIEQIESYLENRENNLLIAVFDDKVDNYPGLDDEQKQSYKQRNKELVLGNVLPAYDELLSAMRELRGVGVRHGGLAALPDGGEYAHALLRNRVGTDKSALDLDFLLEDWLEEISDSLLSKIQGNPVIHEKLITGTLGQIDAGEAKAYIDDLRRNTAHDFPPIGDTGVTVLEVHESLQEHMSPAFYLTPAVDRFNTNVVYVNPASINDNNLFLYTVLAHESYPGHMYQTVYFYQQSPHPIRIALSNTGYSEGWATYAEMMSYFFTQLDSEEAELMWELRFYDMLIQGYADLGVNVLGWSFSELVRVLAKYYVSEDIAENIYNMVVGVPLMSSTYSIGFIELTELLGQARRLQGDGFELMDFHRFYLEIGPAPFPIIQNRMAAHFGAASESAESTDTGESAQEETDVAA